ncbi:MAG TPA: peptidylprolyl isomerase [Gemmatimonadaceae bacterium]|nr:peptidylprolyl isomerase [Gemmatimonadaceae bacterium]
MTQPAPRRRALVALVAGALACTPRVSGAPAPSAGASIDVPTYASLLQMEDARRLDTALVRTALVSRSSPERAEAVLAVGRVHGSAMAPVVRVLVADGDTAVAATAAFALGLLRDSAAADVLERGLAGPPSVGAVAAWSLGAIGASAAPAIHRALGTPHAAAVTRALLLAAAKLRPVPVDDVRPYLHSGDADLRWAAVYAISRSPVSAAVRDAMAHAGDPNPLVRQQVARALSHRAAGDSLAALARPLLAQLATDSSAHVRIEALRAAATYGDASRSVVLAALQDPDANVRLTAAQSLGAVLDGPRAVWMPIWRADTGFAFRAAVLAAAMSHDVVLPAAEFDDPDSWAHTGDWRYRAAVAEAGAAAPSIERMREISLPESRDPDPRVREAGFGALAPHADTALAHPWRREYMYFGLTDRDPVVRAVAIDALAGHATAAELPRVWSGWERAASDTMDDARVALVRYVASAWTRDSASFGDSLVALLRAVPAPAQPQVRAAGAACSLFAQWRDAPVAHLHPLAWYEARVRALVVPALAGTLPRAVIQTVRGPIEIELDAGQAPLTVDNFLALARAGTYDHIAFHRVVPDFVVQDGDARGDGNGGPAYAIRDELNRRLYDRGAVGMALGGPDTGGSQYFITLSPQPHLDGGYTVFGHVTAGYGVLDAIVQGDSLTSIRQK